MMKTINIFTYVAAFSICILVPYTAAYIDEAAFQTLDTSTLDSIRLEFDFNSILNQCEHFWLDTSLRTGSYNRQPVNSDKYQVMLEDFKLMRSQLDSRDLLSQGLGQLQIRLASFMDQCSGVISQKGIVAGADAQVATTGMTLKRESFGFMVKMWNEFKSIGWPYKCSHFWLACHNTFHDNRSRLLPTKSLIAEEFELIGSWLNRNCGTKKTCSGLVTRLNSCSQVDWDSISYLDYRSHQATRPSTSEQIVTETDIMAQVSSSRLAALVADSTTHGNGYEQCAWLWGQLHAQTGSNYAELPIESLLKLAEPDSLRRVAKHLYERRSEPVPKELLDQLLTCAESLSYFKYHVSMNGAEPLRSVVRDMRAARQGRQARVVDQPGYPEAEVDIPIAYPPESQMMVRDRRESFARARDLRETEISGQPVVDQLGSHLRKTMRRQLDDSVASAHSRSKSF